MNKDYFREKNSKWNKEHKEHIKEYQEKNKERIEKWYKDNKERISKRQKKRYVENKEHIKAKCKEYWKTEKWKIMYSNAAHRRRARIKSWEKVTIKMLQDLIKNQNNKCNECSIFLDFNISRFVHLDHIIPISKWGEHKISNLQYLCQTCNIRKKDKIIFT